MSRFKKLWLEKKSNSGSKTELSDNAEAKVEELGLFLFEDNTAAENNLDIIAVHGLGGHWRDTWVETNGKLWLRDSVPSKLKACGVNARVFSYGYDSSTAFSKAVTDITDEAAMLLDRIKGERKSQVECHRPIIFIAHSLGGILVKKAMIIANERSNDYGELLNNIKAAMFLGTPHRGSDAAYWATYAANTLKILQLGRGTNNLFVSALQKNSTEFANISQQWIERAAPLKIRTFYETERLLGEIIVDKDSARLGILNEIAIGLAGANHRSICKFSDFSSQKYKPIWNATEELAQYALGTQRSFNDDIMTSEDISCLQSLAFPEIFYRRQEADKAFLHTCEWILQHKSYKAWEDTQCELLWIKGKPGSGKSTLMAYIYQKLQKNPPLKRYLSLDFFFHGRGTELQKTSIGMFRSLLYQIYDKVPSARVQIRDIFREKRKLGEAGIDWQWQPRELEDLFSNAVVHAAELRTVTIFVDALDEAGATKAQELAVYFHELNNKFTAKASTAKICISCRHYPIAASNNKLNVYMEKENYDDIAKYIEYRLNNELPGPEMAVLSLQECQILKKTIRKRASGVFMWARLIIQLVINFAQEGESLSFINDEITKVPPDLGEVYEYILKAIIPSRNLARTLLLMQWVCLAERPLSVTELRYAMASDNIQIHQSGQFGKDLENLVDTDTRMQIQITSLSGGLVEVKQHYTIATVQFIHQSVNDFLQSEGLKYLTSAASDPQNLLTDFVIGQSHNRLCKSCLNYLRLDEILRTANLILPTTAVDLAFHGFKTPSLLEKLPFILYATKYWFMHAEKAEVLGSPYRDLVQQLGFPLGPALRVWIKIFFEIDRYNAKCPKKNTTLLHIASSSNLRSTVQILLNNNVDLNTQDNAGNTALHYAARWGHTDLVKILLDASANIGAKNKDQSTALERAAANGHEETLQLLLHKGADVNNSTGPSGNALQAAALAGKYIIVRVLLENGADINAQGGDYGNALKAASARGHKAVVQLLLDKGANVNARGGMYGYALQIASYRGYKAIVQLLLDKGANVNDVSKWHSNTLEPGGSALEAASAKGHKAVVQLLLDKGANVNARGGWHSNTFGPFSNPLELASNSLEVASARGYKAVVQLLLDKGADVNAKNASALQVASAEGHKAVVQLLLDKGADVNARGGRYGCALQAASTRGHEAVVKLLLDKGANMNA